ncbi:ABC transporter ATP-binding protein [Tenacibaculum soleae]|uniref:ABC transporter ATP-binding protein n=1 Tax=Tenacibaculum soleae TaxID=447689 RepID=UPI002301134F|nr:ABC transporter ATP-binding protein [Tenacibaculum soleae]
MSTKLLEIQNLYKTFNSGKVKALNNVGFSLKKGNILAVVGESGSGKTTLIRLIAGLETIDEGKIVINSNIVSSNSVFIEPQQRNIGMVFQDYALFPHFTIYKNIAYGLSKHENKEERVCEVLKLVGLSGMEKRYPHELSGGQQQRIALARALAPKPALLILDEPFSNLDVVMRNQLRKDILKILKKTTTTAIFVTHDIKDALEVSDEIIVLKNGIVLQQGKTIEIFNSPESSYVKLLFDSI